MIKYNDYDSLFERFSIMTVDGNVKDDEAIKILAHQTTPELINRLISYINRCIKK